jgi:NADPH:quinone reductase-like Zn-dependent oxidoreductase
MKLARKCCSVCGTVISPPTEDHTIPGGLKFKIGDVVLGMLSYTRDGGAADYALATEDEVALKPMNISAADAASVVTPALVAWQALFRYCGTGVPARSSEIPTNSEPMRVLVNNVDDNNIGRIAIQLLGAKNACLPFARSWICAVCGRQESEALMDESGVDEVLRENSTYIDYRSFKEAHVTSLAFY